MGMIKGTFAQGRTYKVDKKEVLGIILPWSILTHSLSCDGRAVLNESFESLITRF